LYKHVRDRKIFICRYDIRLVDKGMHDGCGANVWPGGLTELYAYLARGDVVKAIHAEGKGTQWTECDMSVNGALGTDDQVPSYTFLPGLLAKNISVTLFTFVLRC
jgi:hypothetical protein